MLRDLKCALHSLWRSRVFTVSSVLALGLAIGANATIFGLIDALWLRPPGVPRPGELTRVFAMQQRSMARAGWSYPEYLELQKVSAFSAVIARGGRGTMVRDGSSPPVLTLLNVVSMNFFSVLEVTPAHGRVFMPGDEAALDEQPGVVLGHAFWQRHFGGDPAVVGRTILLGRGGGVPVRVLAVLPRTFRDLDAAADRDLWLPPATWAALGNREEFGRRDDRWFAVFARRRAKDVAAAQAEVSALVANMAREHPASSAGRTARVVSHDRHRREAAGVMAVALFGLVLIVVLITCVNLAHLILARGAARSREIATRVALGASRWRVTRQLIVESIVLGALGGTAGLVIAVWLMRLLPAILPQPPGFPSFLVFQVDLRVLTFTLAVSCLTTLLFGLAPAWIAGRSDVVALIKGAPAEGGRRRNRVARQALVIAQVAVSLVLLSAAAVLARTFMAAQTADIGIERKALITAWCSVPTAQRPLALDAVGKLEALPGVRRVAVAFRAPLSLSGGGMAHPLWFPEAPPSAAEGLPQVKFNAVSANYFDVLGIDLLRGRGFTEADQRPGEPVVVVNQAFVDRFYGGGEAINRSVRLRNASGLDHRIVGVVENGVVSAIEDKGTPYFYLPYWRGSYGDLTYLVEPATGAAPLHASIRQALKGLHPDLEPLHVIAMAEYVDFAGASYRTTAMLTLALALLGLTLTAVGVYGVVAYRTSRRTREIGVRIALGADASHVARLILGDGVRAIVAGIGIGLPAALWVTSLMRPLLLGVHPWDALALGGASAVLTAAVLCAAFIPAWRASRLSPTTALRTE